MAKDATACRIDPASNYRFTNPAKTLRTVIAIDGEVCFVS